MKKKAGQSIQEYVILLSIIGLSLSAMTIYFKRSVNSVVKVAADQVGSQKDGAVDVDFLKWEERGDSYTIVTSDGSTREEKLDKGAVNRSKNETSLTGGIGSYGTWINEE